MVSTVTVVITVKRCTKQTPVNTRSRNRMHRNALAAQRRAIAGGPRADRYDSAGGHAAARQRHIRAAMDRCSR